MLNNNLLKMKKSVSILGSTGSIGLHSLKIFDIKKSFFNINLLMANKNYNLICQQIKKFKPKKTILTNLHSDLDYDYLKQILPKNVIPAYDGLSVKL